MRRLLLVFALLCGCQPARAAEPPHVEARAPTPAPTPQPIVHDAPYVELKVQGGATHFLGENVLVDYCFVNPTKQPVKISVGGDYRGASRSLRFKATMTDSGGAVMPDPDPTGFSMGGLGWEPDVAPGNRWCQSLPLYAYARFDQPGTYAVRFTHDLGWKGKPAPTGDTTITFAMPTATEAENVVVAMEKAGDATSVSSGKTSAPYRDYFALRYPIYLDALSRRARTGNLDAVDGLGQIPNLDATRMLIGLLDEKNPDVAKRAAQVVSMRLPDPALDGAALGARNPFANEIPEQRKYLIKVGWSPDLAGSVRSAGLKFLAGSDDDLVKSGAFFFEAIGGASDNAKLVEAYTRAIDRTASADRESQVWPTPRGACQELGRAAKMMLARHATPVDPPTTTGEIAEKLLDHPSDTLLHKALNHPNMYVRRLALEALPDAVPAALVPDVGTDLGVADLDVLVSASMVVQRAKLTALGPKTAAVIARVDDAWLLRMARDGAVAAGARSLAADALVARLADPKAGDSSLRLLQDLFANSGTTSSNPLTPEQGKALAPRWTKLIAAHRADIDKGVKLKLDDPSLPKNLFPEGWVVTPPQP